MQSEVGSLESSVDTPGPFLVHSKPQAHSKENRCLVRPGTRMTGRAGTPQSTIGRRVVVKGWVDCWVACDGEQGKAAGPQPHEIGCLSYTTTSKRYLFPGKGSNQPGWVVPGLSMRSRRNKGPGGRRNRQLCGNRVV